MPIYICIFLEEKKYYMGSMRLEYYFFSKKSLNTKTIQRDNQIVLVEHVNRQYGGWRGIV